MPSPSITSRPGRLKRVAGGIVLLAALAVGGSIVSGRYFHAAQATAASAPAEQAVAVTVAVVEPRQTHLWDDFSGRLEAINRVELRPRVAGAILSTNFTEGALVKAGDVLFRIDPAPYAAEVDKAQAQLEAAKARAWCSRRGELERGAQLVGNAVVTKRDYDQRDNANREAIANVKAARGDAANGQTQSRLHRGAGPGRRPRRQDRGHRWQSGRAGTSSPVLTSLVSVNPIYASFDADEDVVVRALKTIADSAGKRGNTDQIPVEMSTSSGDTVRGQIQLIDNQVNGQSGTIRVRAVFHNDEGRLIPGQFARVRMGQPHQQTVVMVDERAIGTDQDKKFVMVVGDDNRAVYRAIALGGAVEGRRIVTSGLKSGDRIVVNGLQRVRPVRCSRWKSPKWARALRSGPWRVPASSRRRASNFSQRSNARGRSHESVQILHRPADLCRCRIDRHFPRRPDLAVRDADLGISRRGAALGRGARDLSRRKSEGDRRDGGDPDRGADQRRRGHALYEQPGHHRRRDDADSDLQAGHRSRQGDPARAESRPAGRAAAAGGGAPARYHHQEEFARSYHGRTSAVAERPLRHDLFAQLRGAQRQGPPGADRWRR